MVTQVPSVVMLDAPYILLYTAGTTVVVVALGLELFFPQQISKAAGAMAIKSIDFFITGILFYLALSDKGRRFLRCCMAFSMK